MLVFNYKDAGVTVFEEGSGKPEVITCSPVESGYLQDLYREIVEDSFESTQNVIKSTKTTLLLQQFADKEVSHG